MTAEQIQLLRDLVAWPSELADQSATAEAIRAAIALAEQTCETCGAMSRIEDNISYCNQHEAPCVMFGYRCGAWWKKDYEGPRP